MSQRFAIPIFRRATQGLIILLLALVLAELSLQGAALLVSDRSGAWREGAETRILCIGDSHTFGVGVLKDEAYPAQLEQELNANSSGQYSVLNLGVPGMSSTQALNRLPRYAARYQPDLVLVWVGSNNRWNQAELSARNVSWSVKLDGLLYHLRLYRLARVWVHDQSLAAPIAVANPNKRSRPFSADAKAVRFGAQSVKNPFGDNQIWSFGHGDLVETIAHGKRVEVDAQLSATRALDDFRMMMEWSRTANIPIIFLDYPADLRMAINPALAQLSEEQDVPVVETLLAVMRVPPEQRKYLWALHPNAAMYREIAKDVAALIPDVLTR